MTMVSMCHISSARVVRRPPFGLAGCTRSRGRRQPNFRTRWYQVEGRRPDLGWGESMGRRVRTGRLIVEGTRVLEASPGLDRLGDNRRNRRSLHNGTNSRARSTARRVLILAPPLGRRSCVNVNPELRSRASASRSSALSFFASPEPQDFLLEFRRSQIRHAEAHHAPRCLREPSTGRRAKDAEIRGDTQVARALDETPKPVVVALLRAGRSRHADDHLRFAAAAQLLEDMRGVRRREIVALVTTTRPRKSRMSVETARRKSRVSIRRGRFSVPATQKIRVAWGSSSSP